MEFSKFKIFLYIPSLREKKLLAATYLRIPQICTVVIQSRVHFNVLSLWSLITGDLYKIIEFFFQFHAKRISANLHFVCNLHLTLDWYFLGIVMACTNVKVIRIHEFVLPFCRVIIVFLALCYFTKTKNKDFNKEFNMLDICISQCNRVFKLFSID